MAKAKTKTYEDTAGQRVEVDPDAADAETQRRIQTGELREVPAEPGGSHSQR